MSPTVDVDATTSVAARDADSVDAGRGAKEVTRHLAVAIAVSERRAIGPKSLRKNSNTSALLGAQD